MHNSRTTAGLLRAVLIVVALSGLVIGATGRAEAAPGGPQPVPKVDLSRYLGTWHQLAAIPAPFNLVCARDTRAHYSLGDGGDVVVRNECTTWAGTPNTIIGTAHVVDKKTSAQLRVRFPGIPNQGGPDGPPNYVIVGLGSDYSWAVVTDPSRLSGFVLSRTPALSAKNWRDVRKAIADAGQSDCLYLTSPTTGGLEETVPLCTERS
ncbi:lipocalin family protein [Gordonia sp. (in: high G+C Gram-positive bacteria)]|uniref:lipocalin family protein n=1 Tax=unclassified Gordonia (in: high G+C Gram-positive bacteria) TaxID=2657482 RepID=UPI003527966A